MCFWLLAHGATTKITTVVYCVYMNQLSLK